MEMKDALWSAQSQFTLIVSGKTVLCVRVLVGPQARVCWLSLIALSAVGSLPVLTMMKQDTG